ncbi:MAG: phosphatidylserine decarboxylase family protein [Bacteroidales bacterium]|nr:phosphatidylserine decarboxylase family protein [Bacteroidales bacterium]MDD3892910.1 phosphatidylserine decarboxylase family protein [Bacteroidales bacterium]
MRIHKEGFRVLLIVLVLFGAICALIWYYLGNVALCIAIALFTPLYIFMLRFFRTPKRVVNTDLEKVLSPCDGTVVVIEEVDEPEFLKERCIQVSIFMSVWNVHINWFPIMGEVVYHKYHPGKFLVAWEPKSSTLNERTSIGVKRSDGVQILFRQIAGYLARRVVCYTSKGSNAKQGEEMGFIKFGSRVDLFLPLNSTVKVNIGQKVKGTQTAIAVIPLK